MNLQFGNQSKSYLDQLLKQNLNSFKAFSYQKLTVNGTAASLTVPENAKYAEIRLESSVTAAIAARYLITGGVPTSTDGMALNNLDLFDITDYQNLVNFKVIQTGAGTHTLHITYYK